MTKHVVVKIDQEVDDAPEAFTLDDGEFFARIAALFENVVPEKSAVKVVYLSKFDESQPRADDGKWTDGGGGSGGGKPGEQKKPTAADDKPSPNASWSSNRNTPHPSVETADRFSAREEKAFAVDANGISSEVGTPSGNDTVKFTTADAKALNGKTLSHNHPSGNPLSPSDMILASIAKVSEVRAIGEHEGSKFLYRATPGASGKWPKKSDLADAFRFHEAQLEDVYTGYIASGKMSKTKAEFEYLNAINEAVSIRFRYKYERVKL